MTHENYYNIQSIPFVNPLLHVIDTDVSSVGKGTVIFLCLPSYYPLTAVGTVIFLCLPILTIILSKCPGSGTLINVVGENDIFGM